MYCGEGMYECMYLYISLDNIIILLSFRSSYRRSVRIVSLLPSIKRVLIQHWEVALRGC